MFDCTCTYHAYIVLMASDGCQVKFLSNFSPDAFVAADVLFSANITPWKNHYHIFRRKLDQHISGCHPSY